MGCSVATARDGGWQGLARPTAANKSLDRVSQVLETPLYDPA